MPIPAHGSPRPDVLAALEQMREGDLEWRSGRTFAYVYDAGPDVERVAKEAYTAFLSENALDPTVLPSVLRLENEVVGMVAHHLGGDASTVGNFTSGDTESIILALKAARDHAREVRGIDRPQMVLPITAHAAFHKAAHYLGIEVVEGAVDPTTFRADPDAMRAAIGPRTALVVASASSYAHGVVDPVREIAAIASERGVLCHVDGCIGGFMLQYFRRLGDAVPDFDLGVPGVTSISMDLHKYAFCPKGASVILYRSKELRRHQIFSSAQWTGYAMVNATVQSSKTAGPIAAAWAVMRHLGDDGYMAAAKGLLEARRSLCDGIARVPGLSVMSRPEMCLIAFRSDELDVFELGDALRARGWYVQPQLGFGPSKANLHLSVNPSNVRWIKAFLDDLGPCTEEARRVPKPEGGLLAMAAALRPADVAENLPMLLGAAGLTPGAGLPAKMAGVNRILDALPKDVLEIVLREYWNEIFTPR
jgi:glutamate/tyrosine decarboxylase-like PLP-dependent enzyme